MDNRIRFNPQPLPLVTETKTKETRQNATAFQDILTGKINSGLKLSLHVQQRLQSRNIELSGEDMRQIENAVANARAKGAKDSLILKGDLALVVSVKNNVVVTAVDGDNRKDSIFTNIDSAVII